MEFLDASYEIVSVIRIA